MILEGKFAQSSHDELLSDSSEEILMVLEPEDPFPFQQDAENDPETSFEDPLAQRKEATIEVDQEQLVLEQIPKDASKVLKKKELKPQRNSWGKNNFGLRKVTMV